MPDDYKARKFLIVNLLSDTHGMLYEVIHLDQVIGTYVDLEMAENARDYAESVYATHVFH